MTNVHVVWRDVTGDNVLARLSRYLAVGNGWSLSTQPETKADLNYYAVYIDQAERHSDWRGGPIAAYFSHYQPDSGFKVHWWRQAEQVVDLRVITSNLVLEYLNDERPVVKVPPAIDPQFVCRPRNTHTVKPRIGLNGFVDSHSSRKGYRLASELARKEQWEVVASGQGWPVVTKLYPWSELPDWFRSLDVFVCTSSIEGIPMPPLEALACGVPVVIPRHVGMLDELPHVPGIYTYEVDSVKGMLEAVELALDSSYSAAVLADCVAGYTPASYCQTLSQGVEEYLSQGHSTALPVLPESDRHGQRGVLYVAYGKPARDCATAAMASFQRYNPGVPVALVSDRPLASEDIFIEHADEDIGGRSPKTLIDTLAPSEWQYVMYLDADTEVVAPLDFLFSIVEDGFDMVICKNPGKYHVARQMVRSDNKDECDYTFNVVGTDELIQLNGGVFVFQRNARTREFFAGWHKEWLRWGKRDQAALLRSLFAHPLKLYVLGNEWNTVTRYYPPETSAGILHYPMTARRWRGTLHDRSDSPQAWQAVAAYERSLK